MQLETAAGAAIKHFKNGHGINVPRSRFLPVKSCSDLLLIKSDIYSLEHGQLVINENRLFGTSPVIKLGDHFKKVCLHDGCSWLHGAHCIDGACMCRSNSSRSGLRRSPRSSSLTI